MILLTLLAFGMATIISVVGFSVYCGISPMPSSKKAREAIQSLLPPDFSGLIYDLGSGWGHLAYHIATQYPHAQVIGFELSPFPWLISRLFLRRKNLTFRCKNFFSEDLATADYLLCYLCPKLMKRVGSYNFQALISNTFALEGRKPTQVLELPDLLQTKIYFYLAALNM